MAFVKLRPAGGHLTATRRISYYVYGRWQVTIPDDVEKVKPDYLNEPIVYPPDATDAEKQALDLQREIELEDWDDRLTDGYLARTTNEELGRFDFGFVRADASMDMNTGASDVEQQIETGIRRSEGDIFFQADVEGAGLGKFELGKDYDVGDDVDARQWGLDIPTFVTSATQMPTGLRIHLGGQLAHDAAALRSHNTGIEAQMLADRRKNTQALSAVRSTASQAATDAAKAVSTAEDAEKKIDQVLENIPDPTLFETYIQEAEEAVLSAQDFAVKAIAAADEADQLTIAMESKLGTVSEYVQRAASHVAAAQAAKDDVDAYAVAAAESAEDAFGYLEESRSLSQQNEKALTQVNQYVEEVASAVASAAASAEQAFAYLGESQLVLDDVRGFSEVAEAAVADAQGFASKVAQTMDEADRVLVDSKTFRDQAQTAKAGAETALSQARGTLDQVVTRHGEVLTWHQEMLAAHDETLSTHEMVLELHSRGIRAASVAAAQASAAVSAQGMVLQVHGQILELHEDAIEYATQTALDASKAAGEAGKAIEAQREIEKQQVLIDQKQDAAIAAATKTGQDAAKAASAAGNAATAAGAAAADATAVAKAVADAQTIQVDVNKKLAAGVRWAGMAAAQAAAATQSLASAVEEVDKATVLAQQTADDALRSAKSAEDAGKIRDAFVRANNDAIWLVNFRALRKTSLEVPIDVRKDYPLGSLGGLSLGMLKVYDSSGSKYLDFEYPDWQGAVSILIKPVWRGTGGSGFWTEIENRTPDTSSTTSVGLSRRDNWPPQNATHFSIEIELSPIWPRDERYQAYFASNKITDPVTGQVVPLA